MLKMTSDSTPNVGSQFVKQNIGLKMGGLVWLGYEIYYHQKVKTQQQVIDYREKWASWVVQ